MPSTESWTPRPGSSRRRAAPHHPSVRTRRSPPAFAHPAGFVVGEFKGSVSRGGTRNTEPDSRLVLGGRSTETPIDGLTMPKGPTTLARPSGCIRRRGATRRLATGASQAARMACIEALGPRPFSSLGGTFQGAAHHAASAAGSDEDNGESPRLSPSTLMTAVLSRRRPILTRVHGDPPARRGCLVRRERAGRLVATHPRCA